MQVDKLMFLFARGSATGDEYMAWKRKNKLTTQEALHHRAKCDVAERKGEYNVER